jgi:hypothetical protein
VNVRGVPLIVIGILAVVAAGLWRVLDKPTQTAVRTAEILGRTIPEAPTVGPIILAAGGAFLILLGVILHAAPQPVKS